jgi:hypothetical protein
MTIRRSNCERLWPAVVCALLVAIGSEHLSAGDLSIVPLLNGERSDSLNLWGGPLGTGSTGGFVKQSSVVRTGTGAYQANLGSADSFEFFQTFSSALNGTPGYRQDRDLTQYQTLEGYVRNIAGSPLSLNLELKDYRDSNSHRATRSVPFTIPSDGNWHKIEAPLNLASGWNVTGTPDLKRTFALSFLVDENAGPLNGSLYLDDFNLIENGSSLDPATASIEAVVERLAKRQFMGLWAARNKTSGIIPNSSDNVVLGALNTTRHSFCRHVFSTWSRRRLLPTRKSRASMPRSSRWRCTITRPRQPRRSPSEIPFPRSKADSTFQLSPRPAHFGRHFSSRLASSVAARTVATPMKTK